MSELRVLAKAIGLTDGQFKRLELSRTAAE
jgi:hypothetical protein